MSHNGTLWLQSSSADTDAAIWSVYQKSVKAHAQRIVSPQFKVEFHGVSTTYPGVDHLDSALLLVSREVVRNAVIAEQKGYAAFVQVSTNDAGAREAREITDMPLAFITEAAAHLAVQTGGKFGWLTHNVGSRKKMELMTAQYGLGSSLVEGASLDMTYHDFANLFANPEAGLESFRHEARKMIARGARVIVPAGGPLNMFFVDHGLREVDGVPVIDILAAVIKAAEQAVALAALGVPQRGSSLVRPEWKTKLREMYLAA